jgi:hypothetical protein
MPFVIADRVKETTTTTGTGNITLAGAATGFRTFSSAIGVNNTTHYAIVSSTGAQWEVGFGTLTGTTTLARTSVYRNSSGGTTALNFSSGTKTVFVTMAAAPRNNNTTLGTDQGFQPQTYQFTTVIGYGAVAQASFSTAVGQYAKTYANNGVAVGGGAEVYGDFGVAFGESATASSTNGVAIGYNAKARSGTKSIAIGPGADVETNSIALGSSAIAPPSAGNNVIIGHDITAAQPSASYMNPFRVDPTSGLVGPAYGITWDSTTKELYAVTGGPSPGGFDWAVIQNDSEVSSSITPPSAFTASPTVSGFISIPSNVNSSTFSPDFYWGAGSTGFNTLYNTDTSWWSAISTPITYNFGASAGWACCYIQYPGAHGFSTYLDLSGSSITNWSGNFGSSLFLSGPSGGPTVKLYGVVAIDGDQTSSVAGGAPSTVLSAKYSSNANQTIVVFEIPDSAQAYTVSSGGAPALTWGSGGWYYFHCWLET